MNKENCQEVNKCIYCKHWLGMRPEPDLYTWECTYKDCKGLCALDSSNRLHSCNDLCYNFQKNIYYM